MAHPLTLPDNIDFRPVTSGLALKNADVVESAIAHNTALMESRKASSAEAVRQEAEIGAEFIRKRSNTTKSLRLTDVERHYQLT